MANEKVVLLAEKLYVMRSTRTKPDGEVRVTYYETPSTWNRSPMEAVIFQNYESGEGHLQLLRERDLKGMKGWADGSTEVIDIVPLYGEILTSPNAARLLLRGKDKDA